MHCNAPQALLCTGEPTPLWREVERPILIMITCAAQKWCGVSQVLGLMQMWKCCLAVDQPILHQLYWNQSLRWNWDHEISLIPNWFSCSPARLLLGPGACPARERWTESFWGSQFPWWLCLSKRVTGQKGGGGGGEWSDPSKDNPKGG